MATENDDSQSMNGILSNISRDVVDTSWDIPPLTFPKLQPTDSEEADGADDVLDVLGIRGGKLRRTGIFAEQFRRDHVHALVGGLRAQHRSHQQFERRIEVQRAFRIGNLHAQLLVFLMHARLLRFPRHASQPTPRMRTNAGNLRKRRNRQKQRKSIEKTTENQQKTTENQRKANENKRNPSNINGMIARKSQLSPDSP